MRQAQELYHSDLIIRAAEHRVSAAAAGLPWHLEDENGDEIGDGSGPEEQAIMAWLEKPQGALQERKKLTRRAMHQLTYRHTGLCGNAFWYQDQRSLLTGTPLVSLYVNPARMWPAQNGAGVLLGWKLDSDEEGNGGIPLALDEVIQFEFEPPDWGHYGIGLVESAGAKADISRLIDRHLSSGYSAGGRLAGLISPKVGQNVTDDQWAAAVRDWRNITNDPDSAKRLHILRGAVDYTRTAATPQELAIEAVAKMAREDKLALWGVPQSQLSLPSPAGLNSGPAKGYDEAVLYQGAVHDRVDIFREVIQFQVLDVIAENGGPSLQLIIEEPEFDDETPAYQRAASARELPLTNNERRAIIGLDPLPDVDGNNEPLGAAVWLPATLSMAFAGPDENGKLITLPPKPEPPPPPPPGVNPFAPNTPAPPAPPPGGAPIKAKPLGRLRDTVDTRYVASTKRDVHKALQDQAKAVATRIRSRGQPKSVGMWWDEKVENTRLRKALEPHNLSIAQVVTEHVTTLLADRKPKKADSFIDTVLGYIKERTGERILGINRTTRDIIAKLIGDGFAEGLGPSEVADSIEASVAFDDARAEMVARTESMFAYNEAALSSYREFDVTEVLAYDGDQDEVCAARDGQTFTVDEAFAIEDHPNGTLDWAPVVKAVDPMRTEVDALKATNAALLEHALQPQPAPVINVTTPDVHIAPPNVTVEPSTMQVDVHIPEPKPRKVVRDSKGQITEIG
jgi:hypothetical protein